MQGESKLLEEIARLAGGVTHVGTSVKQELESKLRVQAESLAQKLDLVSREEFEVLQDMVAKLRQEQESLKQELSALQVKKPVTSQRKPTTKRTKANK